MMTRTILKKKVLLPILIIAILLLITLVCVAVILTRPDSTEDEEEGYFKTGAVAADVGRCSDIGVEILKRGGSAVDAAVAALFCQGASNVQSSGIGGGLFMLVYIKKLGKALFYNGREKAPANASRDMFVNNTQASKQGALSVGVPGEVSAMYRAWQEHGKLAWKDLVQPSIDICKKGIPISSLLYYKVKGRREVLYNDTGFRQLFFKNNGSLLEINDTLVNPELGETLEEIARDPMSFYHGRIAEQIAKDIQQSGGIMTRDDLRNYDSDREEALALQVSLGERYKMWTTHPPSSGPVLAMILQILKGFQLSGKDKMNDKSLIRSYHRIVEAFKFSYAYRALLGDPRHEDGVNETVDNMTSASYTEQLRLKIDDNKIHKVSYYGGFYSDWDDQGTTHLSVFSKEGDAVAVTSTINTSFGSKMRSPTLGMVYNNEMDDFSTPGLVNVFGVEPSPKNFIKPGKRMMSSMTPTVVLDQHDNARLILGASGGTRITTAVAQVFINHLWFGMSLEEAVKQSRLHHQLVPTYIRAEKDSRYRMKQAILDGLKKLGHTLKFLSSSSTVQAISVDQEGRIRAFSDPRKYGRAAGY